MNTPNTVLTDNLNGTFITYNGNELSLQNDMGNVMTTYLSEGFYPIGLTEFGDIIYITSICDAVVEYISVTLEDGANKEALIEQLINAANQRHFPLDEVRASTIFDSEMPMNNDFEKWLFPTILSELNLTYKTKTEESKKFEIGSFPSLNPSKDDGNENEITFEYKYRPFNNLIVPNKEGNRVARPFSTTVLNEYDINHPLSIEVQPSYDSSVNLVLTDGKNLPRLINSGFAVLGNGKGKFTKRNQESKTNYYLESELDRTTRLINNSEYFTKVELGEYDKNEILNGNGVISGGQLKGGNYTFYFKFGDEDGNKTDIVCESGTVSVFKGTPGSPTTISGAFSNELTDKMVRLTLFGINTNYSRLYVYYTREYCDLNGYRLVECKELIDPFKILDTYQTITISGFENTNDISIEELNIAYYSISSAKAIAQQQNMLFLGNISTTSPNNATLQELSYDVKVSIDQSDTIGNVNVWNYAVDGTGAEYYDPQNIYYKLGYWPNELYRFGIVYIKADGTNTQAFDLKGCKFDKIGESNMDTGHTLWQGFLPKDGTFLNTTDKLDNIAGVFKTPDVNVLVEGSTRPLYFTFQFDDELITKLRENDIIGYFIVRQKRIPITVCQGYSIGIDKNCYIPMLNYNGKYFAESFITDDKKLEYKDISVNGDVVSQTKKDKYIYYLYEVVWNVHWWWNQHACRIHVVGPSGSNPDCILYQTEDYNYKDRNRLIEKCISWCERNNIRLENGDTVYHSMTQNSRLADPNGINSLDEEGHIKTSSLRERLIDSAQEHTAGLLSVEAMVNPEIQSMLCGTKFTLDPANTCYLKRNSIMFVGLGYENANPIIYPDLEAKLIYIPEETPLKYIDNVGFSTKSGDGINISSFGFLEKPENEYPTDKKADIINIVRGNYTPFIGAISETSNIGTNILYNIRVPHANDYKSDMLSRANNYAEYYAVSNRMSLNTKLPEEYIGGEEETNNAIGVQVYRGDCFTNTVTIRMHRNFVDSTAPITDKIVKPDAWNKYYKGYDNAQYNGYDSQGRPTTDDDKRDYTKYTYWDEINLSDLNTVSLGHWMTFKCLSSSNLGLRSEDTTNVSEMALMGNSRSFYPLIGASTATGMKLPDSKLLNDGYNATVGRRRYTLKQDTPYDKTDYTNRIMFSNVSVTDSFTNGYRTFQGASYQDYTKQFGQIVKLLPWGNNLFCVFEHGLAIIPINEKALMQTTTEQTIHIYGHGVLPEQISIISQDFGSLWPESVIRTPIGIYGVDTTTKKIWRFTDKNGLETLSDLKLQRFLNDNINLDLTRDITIGTTNVKTHFNNYKGDVMFTFYHTNNGIKCEWNLCYNERQALWVTRYGWIPMFSGNINNTFYSIENKPYVKGKNDIRIWKHGRTGVDTQFYPTLWYGKQQPFEFEFVVNEPSGLHKIFEDLVIVSNNVQPVEIEFEFIGDDYLFNKARIYHDRYNIYGNPGEDIPYRKDRTKFTKENYDVADFTPMFYNARVEYDKVLDTHTLVVKQICKNLETYGRRLGNIQYKEDGWYTNIEPLRYNANLKNPKIRVYSKTDPFISAKLRDKWIKIRIKYKGDRLAIINGVTTFENISYS